MVIDSAFMEKKHTNSGPLRESADKHSIYAMNLSSHAKERSTRIRSAWIASLKKRLVAYLGAADNVSRLFPSPLSD
jgi:hypothetical protein